MTPTEALQALIDGKALNLRTWDEPTSYVKLDERGILIDERGERINWPVDDFISSGMDGADSDNWQLYEGPTHCRVTLVDYWVPVSDTEARRATYEQGTQPVDSASIPGTYRVEWRETK